MKITANEREVLKAILASDYIDGGEPVNNWVWSWSANPWYETSESKKFAGVLVSLMKKGLAQQTDSGRDACVCITQAGYDAIK